MGISLIELLKRYWSIWLKNNVKKIKISKRIRLVINRNRNRRVVLININIDIVTKDIVIW